jgi:hypothetical protein
MADSHDTRTLTFPEMQALADRLQARGVSALGSDSSQSQSDMKLAAAALRGLLIRCTVAGETVGQLGLELTGPVTLGRG